MPTESRTGGGTLIAALIGINEYVTRTSGGAVREGVECQGVVYGSLGCAVNDAALLHDLLRRTWSGRDPDLCLLVRPAPTFRVPGQDAVGSFPATRPAILEAVRSAAGRATPADTVLLYCAGHGTIDAAGRLCLVALPVEVGGPADLLPVNTILEAAECDAGRRLIILDCCQTTPQHWEADCSGEAVTAYIRHMARRWTVWLACSPGECAYEGDDQLRFGVFMARLAEGISTVPGDIVDGGIDLLSLSASIPERVRDEIVYAPSGHLRRKDGRAAGDIPAAEPRQRPVLIGPPIAANGPLRFVFAPHPIRTKRSLRRGRPAPGFGRTWWGTSIGPWPIDVPHRNVARVCAGCLYAASMTTMVLAFAPWPLAAAVWGDVSVVGLASFALWWSMFPFAVAANENYWHSGGWVPSAAYPFWGMLVVALSEILGLHPAPGLTLPWVLDMFLTAFLASVYGANTIHTLITCAEMLRQGDRGDPGHLGRTFAQYGQSLVFDMDNIVSVVAIAPVWYWVFLPVILVTLCLLGGQEVALTAAPPGLFRWHGAFNGMLVLTQCLWFTTGFRAFRAKTCVPREKPRRAQQRGA